MTGCSEIRRWMRASVDSSTSMEREQEEEKEEEFVLFVVVVVVVVVVVGVERSSWTTSFEQRRRPCIVELSEEKKDKQCSENEMRGGGDGVFIYNNKIIIRRERERESGVWEEDLLCGCLHHYACVVYQYTFFASTPTSPCFLSSLALNNFSFFFSLLQSNFLVPTWTIFFFFYRYFPLTHAFFFSSSFYCDGSIMLCLQIPIYHRQISR